MLHKIQRGVLPAAITIGVYCVAGAFVRSAPLDSSSAVGPQGTQAAVVPGTSFEQSFIGTDRCVICHRKQAATWSETRHAQAFDHLPGKYRNDASCLKCHLTAFDEPGGYAAGMSKDEALPFQSVGCEACHGPGARHEDAVKRWTLADAADEARLLGEIKAAILKTPLDSQCAVCHHNQSHQSHPYYDGQLVKSTSLDGSNWPITSVAVSQPPTPESYSVKTCASCHYEQYKTWRIDKHVGLSSQLTQEYENNTTCLECHRKGEDTAQWHTASTEPQALVNQVGVGCESCHGSGFEHVLFNKQYIGGPRLGPELELAARHSIRDGKPATACIQCHVRERHGEHLSFEKPELTTGN